MWSCQASSDDGWGEISAVSQQVIVDCRSAIAMTNLFQLSQSRRFTGAAQTEYLAEANESVFLACPRQFLLALKEAPGATRAAVQQHFGVIHSPWQLGAELRRWELDPQLGEFVKINFADFLAAKPLTDE